MKCLSFFVTLGVVLAGCSPMDIAQIETIDYTVMKQETLDYSELDSFHALFAELKEYLFFIDKDVVFRKASISYPSVDPHGIPVTVSGLVFHPLNRKSRGVIDFMPTAHMHNGGGGSDDILAIEGIMVLFGYTIIVPDLIGTGVSKELPIPLLMFENTGRVSYDMRRAAAHYLWDEFRYQMPIETTIMGYSLGGSCALASLKYYEDHHANAVKVKAVHAGGGAYDLPAAFEVFARTGISSYPVIPLVVLSFKHYYFDYFGRELDLSQVFKGDLLTHCEEWYSGKYSSTEIKSFIGTDLHAYMHDDFFKPFAQQNPTLQSLYPYLMENSVPEGWKPKAPVYMTHANTDTQVPKACSDAAVKRLRKAGANISYSTYPGEHVSVGAVWFVRNFIRLL